MKAILAIDGVSRVIEISDEEFMQGYIDIIYREPFITKASKNEGCAVDNSTEAIKIRAFHHNAYIGNTPLFEADASTNKKDTNLKKMSATRLLEEFAEKTIEYHKSAKENGRDVVWKEIMNRIEDGARAKKVIKEIIRDDNFPCLGDCIHINETVICKKCGPDNYLYVPHETDED